MGGSKECFDHVGHSAKLKPQAVANSETTASQRHVAGILVVNPWLISLLV